MALACMEQLQIAHLAARRTRSSAAASGSWC
jgi:hypothetical protein